MNNYKIAEARTAKGWSQSEFAKRLGTTQQQVARYESGENDVKSSINQRVRRGQADSGAREPAEVRVVVEWLSEVVEITGFNSSQSVPMRPNAYHRATNVIPCRTNVIPCASPLV